MDFRVLMGIRVRTYGKEYSAKGKKKDISNYSQIKEILKYLIWSGNTKVIGYYISDQVSVP